MFADFTLPILITVFAWWFSTGAILWLVRRPRATYGLSLVAGGVIAVVASAGVVIGASDTSAFGAYTAFICALCIWGWHEASFLMGAVSGPRPAPCPDGAVGWRRFKYATLTLIHHEIALAITAAAIVVVTWGQPNQIATLTFLVLLAMRLSAKLNIFLGVPNLTDEFFPAHLEHLKSYLPKRAMNALFPFSVAGGALLCAAFLENARDASQGSGEAVGFTLLFAITALALIEHAFMILPLPDAALWRWAAPARASSVIVAIPPDPHATNDRPIATATNE
ncbi:MAG: putative photosynthetic complex assembly protein PuhE [Hyphomonadaceae bacterium]|nr:putative photosynthetic complex assembly protein PuhE [Hyphomonadaceae bacterium]